jgi:hypothetical protein
MSHNPIIIPSSTSIAQIETIFQQQRILSVLIGDSQKCLGFITRKGLKIRGKNIPDSTPVYELMSKSVCTIDQEEDVITAISIISKENIYGLVVTNQGFPCGVITRYDIRRRYNPSIFDEIHFQRDQKNISANQRDREKEKNIQENGQKKRDSIHTHHFQIALSFSGRYRELVEQVANGLAEKLGKYNIFYDFFYKAHLAQPNLDLILQKIYKDNSKLNVVFLSSDYESKEWCGIEFRVIRELIKKKQTEKIMLLKSDDIDINEILSIDGYLDIRKMEPPKIVDEIIERSQGIPIESTEYSIESFNESSDVSTQKKPIEMMSMNYKERMKKNRPDPTRSINDITRDTRRLR